jgi:hypothetical protein
MKNKVLEKGKWLFQIEDTKSSFDILLHYGDKELFWYRIGRTGRYFELLILGRKILGWKSKTLSRIETTRNEMNMENGIRRRDRLDLNTTAEVAIFKAMQEVEKAGADTMLTEAVILLAKARGLVADYVDKPIFVEEVGESGRTSPNNG